MLGLWAFAVAQPVYDILQRNGEFFIAHRTQPLDLLLFVAVVSLVLPVAGGLPWVLMSAAWPRAGRALLPGGIGLLVAALVSQLLAHRVTLPTPVHFALAGTVGLGAAWAYRARPGVRTFLTMLAPAALVFPIIFLLQPSMSMFMRADTRGEEAAAVINGPAPPIVFLVFDQLPLVSLLDARGQIDRDRYPGFAALADHATWYRNASTVAEYTGWALPPIVSGVTPNPRRTPTTRSYPHNLFTWLGGRYRLEVQEPITQLCPERLCDARRAPLPVRIAGMTLDSSVVYLNVALPAGLRSRLPPLTENWKDFIDDQRWQRRWVAESRQDRRDVPESLMTGISRDDPQPTLYFAHALLPHEPYIYTRSGQAFTEDDRLVGLNQTGRWTTDEWTVAVAYARHLQQLEYVDGVVQRVIARLTAEGLYDRAVIVVTSDHGVSFRAGGAFKALEAGNLAEIMPVPLLIKAPHQRSGHIDDSNVQTVDVMPTLAAVMNVPLTWTPEGRAAGAASAAPSSKTIRYGGAQFQRSVEAADLARQREAAVARKVALFGEGPGWRAPALAHRDLIGRRVDDLDTTDGPWQAVIDDPAQLLAADPAGPVIPGLLSGRVRDARGAPVDADLAIAVNGLVTAVARTYPVEHAPRGTWAAVVNPALFTNGRNDVRVYVLPPEAGRLHLAYSSRVRPEHLNLASRGAEEFWAVAQSGFYAREGQPIAHRWTSGEGALVVPLDPDRLLRSLRIGLTAIRRGGTPLTVTLNDCTLFSGTVDAVPWYRTFSLRQCPEATMAQPYARIVVTSPGWTGDGDGRTRGVAVETVNLFERDWPIDGRLGGVARATVSRVEDQPAPHPAGAPLSIVVGNVGTSVWLSAADQPATGAPVEIALRWRPARRPGLAGERRLPLPHALHPTDRVLVSAPLDPPEALRAAGPWTVTVTPVDGHGADIPVEPPLVVEVSAADQ